MKQLLHAIRRMPKLSGLIAALVATVVVPAVILAWGPERPTFTVANPATYVTFNSITDNSVVGDERNFVAVKDAASTQAGGWQDTINAEDGKEYVVRIYVHNNAAANLNLVAENTRVMAALGTNTGKKVSLTGFVSADNATPKQVYDDVHFTSANNDFNLAYVPGSAKLYNNVTGQAGRAVSDTIVNGSGAQIGYESNNGKVPGCFQYASYVTFKVKPQFAKTVDFTTEKSVRKKGTTQWTNTLSTTPGETVQYRVLFQNTSSVQLDNVMVVDKLPEGASYVPNSTRLYLASDPSNARVMPDGITDKGLNIGSYGKNGLASVIFDAKVDANDELEKCGLNTLKNVATVQTDYGQKSDDAIVTVTKECEEEPEPEVTYIDVCRLEDKKYPVSIKEQDFDDKLYSTDPNDCKEAPQPDNDVVVCDPESGDIITVKESERDNYLPKDSDECKDEVVHGPVDTPEEKPKKDGPITTLPETGITENIAGIAGVGALTMSLAYYVSSRRII